MLGHYPEARNKKGIEPEGLATGTFGEDKLIFVGSERASLVGVYKDTGAEPQFIQVAALGHRPGRPGRHPRRATSSSPPTRPTSSRTASPARTS